jgi:hypothetical protein
VRYRFVCWSDGSTERRRSVNLVGDASLHAIYEEAPPKPLWWFLIPIITGLAAIILVLRGRRK